MMRQSFIGTVALFLSSGCSDFTQPLPLDTGSLAAVSGVAAVAEGVHAPPQVEPGQPFQLSFTLNNSGGSAAEYAEIALAVLRPDGSHAYDAEKWTNVAVPPGGSWHGNVITTLFLSSIPGTWTAIARGRVSGGNWFNFGTHGGVNPEPFQVVTNGAFIATVDRVNVFPSSVPPGTRPQVTAVIQNRSTPDTEWQGHATFNIHAAVRRSGVVVDVQEWNRVAFAPGQSQAGFSFAVDPTALTPGAYEVTYTVRTGDGVHVLAVRREAFWVESQPAETACAAPPEANNPVSYASFRAPPYGFKAATPWLSVVHDRSQPSAASMVEIDFIRLWGRFGRGVDHVISANEYEDGVYSGQVAARIPWYDSMTIAPMPGTISNGVLIIRPSDRQDQVWHPYLERFPRVDITGAQDVRFEVRYRITGPALLQAGLDYWQHVDGTTQTSRNEEAAATDWHCAQGTWNTVWLEPSTQAGPISAVSTVSPVYPARVGVPVSGTFTVHNYDDDTIRLQGIGIETRRIAGDAQYCDHKTTTLVDSAAFQWTSAVLAPGATLRHTARWVPTQPGTYCMKVVEKREWTPPKLYQTVYSVRPYSIRVEP